MKKIFQNAGADIPASIVVFLVALPLCLGIALGSNAPLFSGIIAGIAGGIVIGLLSGSSLSVSGPAAGLTAVVATAIGKLPVFEAFLISVVIAGALQIILGFLKAGIIGDYVPNSVIRGMLAAIGIILILKQLPHFVGYDKDFSGDEAFIQIDQENTFSEILYSLNSLSPASIGIGIFSIAILILWEKPFFKSKKIFQWIPAPLVAVVAAISINEFLISSGSSFTVNKNHLVVLPVANDLKSFGSFFMFPSWEHLANSQVWITGVTIALVASLETLLSIEAVDKLDPYNRRTPTNRELRAQGVGNMVSGLLGGLPVTSVIVRSSANVNAGAKSKLSAILHGILLFLSVLFIPALLNKIPLSALAAILIVTGYKLVKPAIFKDFYSKGWDQLIPFIVTIIAILLTDLLIGIVIGIGVGLFFLVRSNFKSSVMVVNDDNKYLIRFRKDVSFLNKPIVKEKLESVPDNSFVLIDVTRADFIDKDIIDVINEFLHHAHLKDIRVEIKRSQYKALHQLIDTPELPEPKEETYPQKIEEKPILVLQTT
ncbi:MAG: SulP family inorganic anion transporter [Bacteroidetes bacterium]|nr:SulP family inorganic anion transporter [Bacteroidota bacterium]